MLNSKYQISNINLEIWDKLLKKYVKPASISGISLNRVDYVSLKNDPLFFDFYHQLGKVHTRTLTTEESYALGINAYNCFAIYNLITYPEIIVNKKCLGCYQGFMDSKINDSTPLQTYPSLIFQGKKISLDAFESLMHPIPKAPLFNTKNLKVDLRIHACLVCGGVSCPNLSRDAYLPSTLYQQMSQATIDWMKNPYKGMRIANTTPSSIVYWSSIMSPFPYFKDEFDSQGGVLKVYWKYLPQEAKDFLRNNPNYKTCYLDYIWQSNGALPCNCLPSVIGWTKIKKQTLNNWPVKACLSLTNPGEKDVCDRIC